MASYETNTKFVKRLMEFSPQGALSQVFILAAIEHYAKEVAENEPIEHPLINGEAWKACAENILSELAAKR